MTKKLTTEQRLNEFEELQALIKDVLDLKKKLDDGGNWVHATREEAQFYLDSIKELNEKAKKYTSKVKAEGLDFLTEIEKELPKEKTTWDGFKEQLEPLKKLGDSVAKFFGQDSLADVADTVNSLRGQDIFTSL